MESPADPQLKRRAHELLVLGAISGGLVVVSRFNYLLFHSLVELFSIAVALSVFVIAWTGRNYLENGFLLVVGVAFLPIGLLDLLHALSFTGMAVLPDPPYAANQLWIAARALEALALLGAFFFLDDRRRPDPRLLLALYGGVTALLVASIFGWRVFPVCFVEGAGLTPFKIAAEWVVIGVLAACLVVLQRRRDRFAPVVRRAIAASILLAIAGEFSFTLYESSSGASNLVGHVLKLLSFVGIYVALVESCVERPFDVVFRDLSVSNARLKTEIAARKASEQERERAMVDLLATMEELQTLRGIIPICSHCKKVRDDRGAWSQVEAYIQKRSAAQFSHGLCPDCQKRYFPDEPDLAVK